MNKREWKQRRWRERAAKRWLRKVAEIARRAMVPSMFATPNRQWFTLRLNPSLNSTETPTSAST